MATKKQVQKLIDIHVGHGNCFTLRLGWFIRVKGEQRYYHIKGMRGYELSLDTYQLKGSKGVLTGKASGYQFNANTFSYRALKDELIHQKQPFGEHIALPPPKVKPKAKEIPKPIKTVAKPAVAKPPAAQEDSIMDLFGI